MGIISVPPLHNLSRISEENITDNRVRRQSAKAKDSVMPEIELNNSAVGATRRVEEKKSYAEVAKIAKTSLSPKVSANISDIVSDLLETRSNSSGIKTSFPWLCTNLNESPNFSNVLMEGCGSMTFSTQDRKLVSILEGL